jgi:protein-S-isoprenylcysteine O-methyltransferase Ste14
MKLVKSVLRFVFIAIGTCVYAGLAIIGGGGFHLFFSHRALIALVAALVALSTVAFFAGGNLALACVRLAATAWIIPVFMIIGFLNVYLPAYTDRKELWTIDGDTIRWLGVVLFAAGGAFRIWPVFVLGQRFSGLVAIQPGHALVTSGVYGVIRHPSYLGLLINSLGWSLAFRSGVGVILTLLLVPPLISTVPTALIHGA